jgi:tetratricopeptide (TPR) repeat protein
MRRIKYEFNEERYLMASDIDPYKCLDCNAIKITYGSIVKNRRKLDYWRNVDGVRFEYKNALTSKNYHSYCGDSINCGICTSNDNYPEIYLSAQYYNEINNVPKHELYEELWDSLNSIPEEDAAAIRLYHSHIYPTWLTVAGDEWLFFKDSFKARFWISKEIEFDPNASSYWALGETFEMEDSFASAIENYQIAFEYDPAYSYRVAKARVYMKQGRALEAAKEYCFAICDINDRCDNNIMNYMRIFKYELMKSRLLTCPPYLTPSPVQSLADITKLLQEHRASLPDKEYLQAMTNLFWTIEHENHLAPTAKQNTSDKPQELKDRQFSPLVK